MNMYLVWLEYCFHGNLKDYITRNREYFINEEQNTGFNILFKDSHNEGTGGGREGRYFRFLKFCQKSTKICLIICKYVNLCL